MTKLAGSQAVLDAVRAGRADGLVLRAANVCGPHPSPASFPGKLVGMLRRALSTGEPMTVVLTGARRDFVDVRDLADAVVRAVHSPATGHALNIGSGRAIDMRTLVRLFVTSAGHSADLIDERIRDVSGLGGAWTRADIRLAGRLLDWHPRIGLAESLAAMWAAATTTDGPSRRKPEGGRSPLPHLSSPASLGRHFSTPANRPQLKRPGPTYSTEQPAFSKAVSYCSLVNSRIRCTSVKCWMPASFRASM